MDWLPFVDEWLAESSQVVVPDLRGHGDASGFCTLGRLEAEDLVGLIKSLDEEPVRLVGCGFGANIVIRTASMVPDEIHEVVAINPWPTDVNGILNRLCMSGMQV
ncbi:MAG: alpha/beta hydrolase, partial [Planctomycetaceae bacterium]|nr:alpha/beta hydrolase [Planctomycetaceae bacterium]